MRVMAAALLTAAFLVAAPAAGAAHGGRARPVDLDVLFVGAHPDDEAVRPRRSTAPGARSSASAPASSRSRAARAAATRSGPEEGPPLGLLREAEERRAVAPRRHPRRLQPRRGRLLLHGVRAADARGVGRPRDAGAGRARRARDPPGGHRDDGPVAGAGQPRPPPARGAPGRRGVRGGGGPVARSATQITEEGLRPWRVKRLFRDGAAGRYARRHRPRVRHVASRRRSRTDETFGAVERARAPGAGGRGRRSRARRSASTRRRAGPGSPTSPPTRPRSAATASRRSPRACRTARAKHGRDAMLEGALGPRAGRPAAGHRAPAHARPLRRRAGREVALTVRARGAAAARARARAARPPGRLDAATRPRGSAGCVRGRDATATLRAPRPRTRPPGRVRIPATLRAGGRTRHAARRSCASCPPVRGTLAAAAAGRRLPGLGRRGRASPQLDGLVNPVAALAPGRRATCGSTCATSRRSAESGTVALRLPPGFAADAPSKPFAADPARRPGASPSRSRTPTRRSRPRSRAATTRSTSSRPPAARGSSERAALNLVPVTTVPQAAAARCSTAWSRPASTAARRARPLAPVGGRRAAAAPADASGSAKLAWSRRRPVRPRRRHRRRAGHRPAAHPTPSATGGRTRSSSRSTRAATPRTPRRRSRSASSRPRARAVPAAYRDADNRQGAGRRDRARDSRSRRRSARPTPATRWR